MRIKRDHKAAITDWLNNGGELKKVKAVKAPKGCWIHVPYCPSGGWTSKKIPKKKFRKKSK